jgi:hypothetical protein
MINFEFSKEERKIVVEIIKTGLQREYEKMLTDVERIMEDWKTKKNGAEETYAILYRTVKANDQRLERVNGNKKGSTYILILLQLLSDGVLTEDDLNLLPRGTVDRIIELRRLLAEGV